MDKSPRDLPLYAPYVMRILAIILRSKDLSMVEDSLPTFDAFCAHHDSATLAAYQVHNREYEEIVKMYASFASEKPPNWKGVMSASLAQRWRSAGLQAIKSIVSSEAVGRDGGKQLDWIIPPILQNLYSGSEELLQTLLHKAEAGEKAEKDAGMRRRMSIATVRTVETIRDPNATASATTADADRAAEEEVGLLALQSLKEIYSANNRAQIRMATTALLRFVISKTVQRPNTAKSSHTGNDYGWAMVLMEMVARWAPVQDRFVILVTSMESLIRSPVTEESLGQQLVLVTLIGWLLGSSINMIGLSVMDVLLGLIQHILRLLQLGGKGSYVLPHHQQTDALNIFDTNGSFQAPIGSVDRIESHDVIEPSRSRQELLLRLRKCIGELATHTYYSDQISDIISAILLRLKPSPNSGIKTTAEAIEHPAATAQAISNSVNLQENPSTNEFFSFGTARVTALNSIKEVLNVANMKKSGSGTGAIGRNKVGMQVWEGTQWLLRDEDQRVRRAYVDALLTWMRLELSKEDARVHDAKPTKKKVREKRKSEKDISRAGSNASRRSTEPTKSTFLQLLHLAIYDNALEAPENVSNIIMLHLLLSKLVEKVGVHAVKSGLPMITRLQEDINIDTLVSSPMAKLNIGSLVHGYFWTLMERFEFDTTLAGYAIHNEISRRQKHNLWLSSIKVPPFGLDKVVSAASEVFSEKVPEEIVQKESLKPFDACPALVEQIASAYTTSFIQHPASPPGSPGRGFTMPMAFMTASFASTAHELPAKFKEDMLSPWTKESCIAAAEHHSVKASSLNGSRSGTNRSARHGTRLTVNGNGNGHTHDGSPMSTSARLPLPKQTINPTPRDTPRKSSSAVGLSRLPLPIPDDLAPRRLSVRGDDSPTPISSSDKPILRIDDLKRILAGGGSSLAAVYAHNNSRTASHRGISPLRTSTTTYQDFASGKDQRAAGARGPGTLSSGSDSVVSAEGIEFESASEGDLDQPMPPPQSPPPPQLLAAFTSKESPPSKEREKQNRPRTASSASEDPEVVGKALKGELVPPGSAGTGGIEEDVPPVPPLPDLKGIASGKGVFA